MIRLVALLAAGAVGVPTAVLGAQALNHGSSSHHGTAKSGRALAESISYPRTRAAIAVRVRLTKANRARRVGVALYTDSGGQPASLLSAGFSPVPKGASHPRIVLTPPVTLTAHEHYWLAVLGVHGRLGLRAPRHPRCSAELTARGNLQRFPRRWFPGPSSPACPFSARLLTRPGAVPPGGYQRNCLPHPSACGYPDPTNTGPPRGMTLRPSGTIHADRPGQVISGVSVTDGDIEVRADNVTIENSEVTTGDGTLGANWAIYIAEGVTGTVIRNVSLHGADCGPHALLAGVWNTSGDRLTMNRVQGQCLDDILHGPGRLLNSYSIDNANIPDDHYEPVADDGGGGSITLIHDTLLNTHYQTAAVFVSCQDGPVTSMTVTDSLLAGGDYVLYGPEANGPCDDNTGPQTVTDNRFSRAWFKRGGYYGTHVDFVPGKLTWSGNIWDDNLRPVRR
jgi:hypothetical protein